MDTTEIPWWVAALIVPAAVAVWSFLEKQVWPAIARQWQNSDAHEARAEDEERKWRHDLEERRVVAQEVTAQALDGINRTLAVMQFQIAAIERHLGLGGGGGEKIRARARGEGME